VAGRLGEAAKETVRQKFLITRLMEDWLDLMGAFEAHFQLKGASAREISR
jgi:trehalose synthase